MCSIFWDDLLMQGRSRPDRELLDAEMIAGHLVPPGSVFAFLAQHRGELFPDSFTADLFPSATGRPSLPADLVGSVLVLKELYDLSDPQTADALKFDIRWKVACGRSLTQVSFDPSTLVYWRKRIAASDRPDRVFDAVAQVIAETGILRGRRRRCVDSTVFDDAVATMDTVSQRVAAMRKVARVVPGAGEVIARVCRLDYSKPGKPDIDWDDPQARQDLVSDLVNDALAVLAELAGPASPERDDAAADALGLLALVAGQDVEPAEDSDGTDGRWRIARKVAPDRVISTVDREARHTRKSKSKRRGGVRGHVAAEPDTRLITHRAVAMAARRGPPGRPHHRRGAGEGGPPGRAYPADERQEDRHLRAAVCRVPAPDALHHRQRRPVDDHPPARGAVARRPRAGPHRRVQARLSDPVDDRTGHRLDRYPEGPPHPAPLHRRRQERRLAAYPVRRHQPADPGQGRAGPRRRGLGPGLTRPPVRSPMPAIYGPNASPAPNVPGIRRWPGDTRIPRQPERRNNRPGRLPGYSRGQRCSEAS